MKEQIKDGWRWCRRYITFPLIVAVGYVLFVVFFNENSYSRSAELQEEINALEAEIKENNDTMQYYRRLNAGLDTDPVALERIVRENYHMLRVYDDVYIVTE